MQLTVSGNFLDLRYGYDRVGNITAITDTVNNNQVQTFGYDARDRLVWARTNGVGNGQYNEAYGYDRMGNIITRTVGGQPVAYAYGCPPVILPPGLPPTLSHRVWFPLVMKGYGPDSPPPPACVAPFAVVSTTAGFRAAYDPNGNMVLRVEVSGTQRITYMQEYNADNRLVAVTTRTGTVQFRYDGDGNRVLRIGPEGITVYIGDYYERQGSVVTQYYYAAGQRIAVRVGGVVYWLQGDHLGSATLTTGAGGNWVGEARYTPYGEMRRDYPRGVIPTDRRYTGQRQETFGLYDYQARYYSPGLGRFVSADTLVPSPGKPQTLNRYAYGGNNPILYDDPDGRCGPLCGTFVLVGTLAALTIALDEYILEPAPGPGEYNARESYRQAVKLVRDWFYNIEPRERFFGPESPLTQDIMHDPGMIAFRQKWAEAGYPLPWSWEHKRDEREKGPAVIRVVKGMGAYAVENVQLGLTAIGMESDTPAGSIDAVGGIIGSLDKISVYPAERGMVKIEVRNEMNWKSGLRIPGTNRFIADLKIPGTDITVGGYLEARGWGKNPLGQTFYWWEPLPGASWRMRPGR